jgi:excisionase family DNA binding protein
MEAQMESPVQDRTSQRTERMVVSISDVAWTLSVSENHVRNLLARGELKRVNLGRRVLVTTESIKALLATQQAA